MPSNPLRIEAYRAEHTEELLRMWRESFEFGVGITDTHSFDEQRRYLLGEVVPNNTVRVAFLDGRMAGFVAATAASISQLYVRKGLLRQGIGTQLLEWAKAQSGGHLWLFTFERNSGARAFYERHGFRIAARGFETMWQLEDIRYEWKAGAMHADEVHTDAALARRLLAAQFPQWAGLPVEPVRSAGTDNALYRLGDAMVMRFPRIPATAGQVAKEQQWLPKLAPLLPLEIPVPLAMGSPGEGFPWHWSVCTWLDGENATIERVGDPVQLAKDLARFITALHRVDPAGGPAPGEHNSFRGVPLAARDDETRDAICALGGSIDGEAAMAAWDAALREPQWSGPPTWIHGDMQSGNLLAREGSLAAVIDFGLLGVGDPACDLIVAWNLLSGESREALRAALALDDATWARGRGWALSVGLIALPYYEQSNPSLAALSRHAIDEVLADSAEWTS